MRALVRPRTLAVLCALLLLTFGSIAQAKVPSRPIDSPEGPPIPNPTEVGDPDAGHEMIVIIYRGRFYVIHLPSVRRSSRWVIPPRRWPSAPRSTARR